MKILYVAWTDLGKGNQHRANAINECTDSEAETWSVKENCDEDKLIIPDPELERMADEADIIHQSDTHDQTFNLNERPNLVMEFRGGLARMYSNKIWFWQMSKKTPVITTPELSRYFVRSHYIPVPLNVSDYKLHDGWDETSLPLKICHTPSRRDYKDTDTLIRACERVDDVELTLIEGKPLAEAIEVKRDSDVCFGQIKVGSFGSSEREAMSYGCAVLGRLLPIERAYNPGCPIVDVWSEDTIIRRLREMVADLNLVSNLKRMSRGWAESFLSYRSVGPRQEALYDHFLYDDPHTDLWDAFKTIYRDTAEREHGIDKFIDPPKLRW